MRQMKMSKTKTTKPLKHGEVQKKILAPIPKIRPKEEQLGPFDKFRDENFALYNAKKKQFLEICKKYNRLNQETLICCKNRLLEDYRESLDCAFLLDDAEDCGAYCPCDKNEHSNRETLIRMRTERRIHQTNKPPDDICCIDPWFRRYLTLNKFIWAARTIVIKNRLEKVLARLKTVTAAEVEELEKHHRTCLNVTYADIFQQYM